MFKSNILQFLGPQKIKVTNDKLDFFVGKKTAKHRSILKSVMRELCKINILILKISQGLKILAFVPIKITWVRFA